MTAPTPDELSCPECRAGKHPNCDGVAWDLATDSEAECRCPHLVAWYAAEREALGLRFMVGMTREGETWTAPAGTPPAIPAYPPPPPWTYQGRAGETQEEGTTDDLGLDCGLLHSHDGSEGHCVSEADLRRAKP